MSKQKNTNPIGSTQLKEMVRLQAHTKSTLIVFGPSGVGKTTIMEGEASAAFDSVRLTNLAGKGPAEATGLGLPRFTDGEEGLLEMIFSQPEGIPTVERVGNQRVYWILDEWGNWDPQVRAAFHGVLSPPSGKARYLGSHLIGPNVVCGITSNRRCDGAAVGRYSIPECRRGFIVTLVPSPAEWWQWADSVPAYADTLVPAFIAYGDSAAAKEQKNHFLGDPVEFDPLVPNAQPSPRSWEEAMKVLAAEAKGLCTKEGARIAVDGWVGPEAGQAVRAFRSLLNDRPAFDRMKRDPLTFAIPTKVSDQFMLASGALLLASQGISDIEMALHQGRFDWVFDALNRMNPEVGAYGLVTASRRGMDVAARRPEMWTTLVGN